RQYPFDLGPEQSVQIDRSRVELGWRYADRLLDRQIPAARRVLSTTMTRTTLLIGLAPDDVRMRRHPMVVVSRRSSEQTAVDRLDYRDGRTTQLAIVHYHLNRGGVTQVIINQLRALDLALQTERPWRVVLVSSGCRVDWPEQLPDQLGSIRLDMIEIPAMDYDRDPVASPGELARQIREGLRGRGYSADDTILHVHNHSLGKNLSLPGAIRILACDGFRLLLQIHDFAEDYRHEHYARMTAALATMATDGTDDLAAVLYPQAEHIHYATLNRRDWSMLRDAGVPLARLHLLPNPVPELGTLTARADARVRL